MQDADRLREVASDCVHCGFCLPACPTYQLWGEEMDSPRGRIYLVNQILDGADLTPAAVQHFDRCLGCMACMTACPSGVQYDQLIEAARVWTEEARPALPATARPESGGAVRDRALRDRAARAAIFALFPYPRRLRAMTRPLQAAQRTGLDRRLARSSLPGRLSPVLGAALRLGAGAGRLGASGAGRPGATGAGRLAPPASAGTRLPERVAARGPRRAVVGMLTGCVQSVFFPQVNAATARVLALEGCDVIIPRSQGCCGALSLHSGREAEAGAFARRTIETFERAGVDTIVVNSAGCGSAMKEYERLLSGDPDWAGRAAAVSGRVRDLSEFLAELGPAAPRHPLPVTAAYHDACHLGHAQRITRQPRELLRSIPELTLVELPDAGTCCGSAGVYNLLQPEAASELGARKAQAVLDAGAPLLISANPGCSLQIAAALADRGEHVAVAHTAEILDASLRGLPAPATPARPR
jgi:glycolate oxidase iron-sulfur subunit